MRAQPLSNPLYQNANISATIKRMQTRLTTLAVAATILTAAHSSPLSTTAPAAAPSTQSGCYPLTNGGNCYQPGEFCRHSDHGASGVAGNGENIVCENNDGWRWEPAS